MKAEWNEVPQQMYNLNYEKYKQNIIICNISNIGIVKNACLHNCSYCVFFFFFSFSDFFFVFENEIQPILFKLWTKLKLSACRSIIWSSCSQCLSVSLSLFLAGGLLLSVDENVFGFSIFFF